MYVVTHGYGTDMFPRLNERVAPWAWTHEDLKVHDELNGQPDTMLSPDGYFVGSLREPPTSAPAQPVPSPSTPFIGEHLRYLNRSNYSRPPPAPNVGTPQTPDVAPGDRSSFNTDITNWMASLAGVNPVSPTQPGVATAEQWATRFLSQRPSMVAADSTLGAQDRLRSSDRIFASGRIKEEELT